MVCKECGKIHQVPVYSTNCQNCGIKVPFEQVKEKGHVAFCKACLEVRK